MNDYLLKVHQSLTENEQTLRDELNKVSEAKKSIEMILYPKDRKSSRTSQNQSGKSTMLQALETKDRILNFLQSNKTASASTIVKKVKKPNGQPYTINTVRTYLSNLKKTNKISRVQGKRVYEVVS
jgi:hypothetical protein